MKKRVGALLKLARTAAKLSMRDLARLTGMTDGQLSQIESGRRADPAFSTVAKYARAVGLSLDALDDAIGEKAEDPTANVKTSTRDRLALQHALEAARSEATRTLQRIDAALQLTVTTQKKRKRPSGKTTVR